MGCESVARHPQAVDTERKISGYQIASLIGNKSLPELIRIGSDFDKASESKTSRVNNLQAQLPRVALPKGIYRK
jgi:hypothetical protein